MLPIHRYDAILSAVKKGKFLTLEELLDLTGSSLSTLRRDLSHLEEEGMIKKTMGGISLAEKEHSGVLPDMWTDRQSAHLEEKKQIALQAQQFIEIDDIILLFNGTTTSLVAEYIDPEKSLTVITNGLDVVYALRRKKKVKLILLGGIVSFDQQYILGPSVVAMLENLHPSKIITGAAGITEQQGITNLDFIGSEYYKATLEKAGEVIVVADHSKFGKTALIQAVPFDRITTIVSDKGIDPAMAAVFEKHNIEYVLA